MNVPKELKTELFEAGFDIVSNPQLHSENCPEYTHKQREYLILVKNISQEPDTVLLAEEACLIRCPLCAQVYYNSVLKTKQRLRVICYGCAREINPPPQSWEIAV